MADFWASLQKVIDLGEEKSSKPTTTATGRDLDSLSQSELATLCSDLQTQYSAKCAEYDKLVTESSTIRKEHDDFRLKAESWQQQMKVLREDDRRLIEQLRAAKQGGENTEEVMTQALQETVTKLKEEVKAAHGDRDREARRRTESELAMKRLEQENQREVAILKQNFDALKQKLKKQEEEHQIDILNWKKKNEDLVVKVKELNVELNQVKQQQKATAAANDELSPAATSGRVKELVEKLNAVEKALAKKDSSKNQEDETNEESASTSERRRQQQEEDDPSSCSSQQPQEVSEKEKQVEKLVSDLQSQIQTIQAENFKLAIEIETSTTSTQDALREVRNEFNRKIEKLEIEKQDAENNAASLRGQINSLESKCSSLENSLEEKGAMLNNAKRHAQQREESLEQTIHEEKSQKQKTCARLEAQIEQLKKEIEEMNKESASKDQMVSDVAVKSKAAEKDLENQRSQLEASILAQEAKVQEANSRRLATETSLNEALQEIRKRNSIIDETRQELDRAVQRLEDAENQVLVFQKSLSHREQESLDKNRKIQSLEIELENERKANQDLRQRAEDLNQNILDLKQEREKERYANLQQRSIHNANSVSSPEPTPRESSTDPVSPTTIENNNAADSERWASATREWLARLDHERRVAAEAVRVREEQSAKMRQLESRLDEMTFKLSSSEASLASLRNSTGTDGATAINMPSREVATASSVLLSHNNNRWVQQVVLPAVQKFGGGVLSWNKKALAIAFGIIFLMILIFNWIAAAQTSVSSKQNEFEMVQQKYSSCLDALARCNK